MAERLYRHLPAHRRRLVLHLPDQAPNFLRNELLRCRLLPLLSLQDQLHRDPTFYPAPGGHRDPEEAAEDHEVQALAGLFHRVPAEAVARPALDLPATHH